MPSAATPSRVLAALFALALAAGLATVPSAAYADDVNGLSASPSNGTSRDGRTRFDYQASPGQDLTDAYLVRNTGTTRQKITVFGTDAFSNDDGDFALLDTVEQPSDVGAWITFSGKERVVLDLKPGAEKVVLFTVHVPDDATPGDHAGGVVVSAVSQDGSLTVDRRVATRIYLRVPGDLQAGLSVSGLQADYQQVVNPFDGSVQVTTTVTNTGNVALGANMVFGVNTWFGIGATDIVRQELPELLPGGSRTLTVTLPGVAQLGYLDAYVRMIPTVDPGALDPGPLREVSRDTVVIAWPWWLLAILVVALIVFAVIRLRRRSDEKRAAAWVAYTEAEAQRKAEASPDAADGAEAAPVGAGTGQPTP
ncbi:WxL protein peptidoglycan domain-containing protein [Homoserinibacter sp. GY 40078]|uniref:WxL protein peptidoglycan domain-containing protein n=1 Tax=Homoserinibacter sp. GY 40078 TaxID=2603275 RepID=UPI00164F33A8|nr:DUF916 domain-containing protein [Homoserinibacter sp. GY 40078]